MARRLLAATCSRLPPPPPPPLVSALLCWVARMMCTPARAAGALSARYMHRFRVVSSHLMHRQQQPSVAAAARAFALAAASKPPQRVGIVGGLGLGAGIHYYKELAAARADVPLELAMVHCQLDLVLDYVDAGDKSGLVLYLESVLEDLKAAGATFAAIPAVTPHYCIDMLQDVSPLPLVDMLAVIKEEVAARKYLKVALFGTAAVQLSACYGRLHGVTDVVTPPPDEVALIGDLYTEIARSVGATEEQRQEQRVALAQQAEVLISRDGVDAILLAGTDLSAVFTAEHPPPFPYLDCAALHIAAIAKRL